LNTDFEANVPLYSGDSNRPKGWRGLPLLEVTGNRFGAKLIEAHSELSRSGQKHVVLGIGSTGNESLRLSKGQSTFLAQEVRSPFAGKYVLKAYIQGAASSREFFETVFLKQFACRLQFFQFTTKEKLATERKELASVSFVPRFVADGQRSYESFELEKVFENPSPGGNFSFGLGLGVAILIEKTSDGILTIPATEAAFLRIDDVTVEFTGKSRIETVKA